MEKKKKKTEDDISFCWIISTYVYSFSVSNKGQWIKEKNILSKTYTNVIVTETYDYRMVCLFIFGLYACLYFHVFFITLYHSATSLHLSY